MNLIESIFDKPIDKLTLEDIRNHFSSFREESTILEYKSYSAIGKDNEKSREPGYKEKVRAVMDTICAFLNSSGGVLIWGAPREVKGKDGKKHWEKELSPVTQRIVKDDFISKIKDTIFPPPAGINMNVIPVSGNQRDSVIVFEVPNSIQKPHQIDGRYMMRLDGQTIGAPHHYVEALFNSIQRPVLNGTLQILKIDNKTATYPKPPSLGCYIVFLEIKIWNDSVIQSEEKVSYIVTAPFGKLSIDRPFNMRPCEQFSAVDGLKMVNSQEILLHGFPYERTIHLEIWDRDLSKNAYVLNLELRFGGRFSPLRSSTYSFKVQEIPENAPPYSLTFELLEKNENKLLGDESS